MHNKEVTICLISKTFYEFGTGLRKKAKALQASGGAIDVICIGSPEKDYKKPDKIKLHSLIKHVEKTTILKYLTSTFGFAVLAFMKFVSLSKARGCGSICVTVLWSFLTQDGA